MSFQKLDELGHKLEALEHALAILGADEATHMAVGGGEKRAEAMSSLAGMLHRQATEPRIGDWLSAAETELLNEEQQAAVRELRRQYTNLTCLPAEFVERQTMARMRSEQLWRDLRAKNDWTGFLPALEGVIALVREEAALRADALGLAPYDALMEQYDPGNRAADITPVFAELKAFLKDFLPHALAVQDARLAKHPLKPLSGSYAIEKQRELGLAMMAAVGFDLTHGSLSVSHHPFCGGVHEDVRITTRYREDDFVSALMATLACLSTASAQTAGAAQNAKNDVARCQQLFSTRSHYHANGSEPSSQDTEAEMALLQEVTGKCRMLKQTYGVSPAQSIDVEIPGLPFTFGTLITAQAAGDAGVLAERGRPVLRLHLTDPAAGVQQLLSLLNAHDKSEESGT